jgi:hypothetical protein
LHYGKKPLRKQIEEKEGKNTERKEGERQTDGSKKKKNYVKEVSSRFETFCHDSPIHVLLFSFVVLDAGLPDLPN